MPILRYNRVSTADQSLSSQQSQAAANGFDFLIEERVSGMVPFFERPEGKVVREMVVEGRIDEISVYSVDRISRSIKDLCEIISFLHEHSVCLCIENMGIRSLVEGSESPAIMLTIHLQGAFATLNYWDRRERQRAGIEQAKLKGVYRNQVRKRGKERVKEFLGKPKVRKVLSLMRRHPRSSNAELAVMGGIHRDTARKIRALAGIPRKP